MISKKTLRELIDQKVKDADILIANRRYASAIYISGYALEVALKLKICKIFKFSQGFPENRAEFMLYQNSTKSRSLLSGIITQIKEIKNHDLNKLLFYSGVEVQVKRDFLMEWNSAVAWNPDMRYKIEKVLKREATGKVTSIKTIVENIL